MLRLLPRRDTARWLGPSEEGKISRRARLQFWKILIAEGATGSKSRRAPYSLTERSQLQTEYPSRDYQARLFRQGLLHRKEAYRRAYSAAEGVTTGKVEAEQDFFGRTMSQSKETWSRVIVATYIAMRRTVVTCSGQKCRHQMCSHIFSHEMNSGHI